MNKYLNRILDDSTELTTTTSLAVKYYEAYNRYIAGGQKRRADKLESTYKQTISFPYLNDPRLDSVLIRKGRSGITTPRPIGRRKIPSACTSFPRPRRCHRPQPLRPLEQRHAHLHRDIHALAPGQRAAVHAQDHRQVRRSA